MEMLILDQNFISIGLLDEAQSMIWTDRYNSCGDFEIHTPMSSSLITSLQTDYYLWQKDSEHMMIIENQTIDTDPDKGKFLKVTGRSLESILDRRIVWHQTVFNGSLQNGIQKLLNDNIISPVDANRKISNFVFEASTDSTITALTINTQYLGDNLLDVISKLCSDNDIGFKITLSKTNQFVFKLYVGTDRSYNQMTNPQVVFSPKNENIGDCNFIQSKKTLKNATLVGGEGEGSARKTYSVGTTSGLDRREIFTDASSVSSTVDGSTISTDAYNTLLNQKGLDTLSANTITKSFEGKAETTQMYTYGKDFFMGDIVQFENEYGMTAASRVTEFIQSQDTSGISTYPTFSAIS